MKKIAAIPVAVILFCSWRMPLSELVFILGCFVFALLVFGVVCWSGWATAMRHHGYINFSLRRFWNWIK